MQEEIEPVDRTREPALKQHLELLEEMGRREGRQSERECK